MGQIVTIENKKDEKFLRKKTEDFDFKKFSKKEIEGLIRKMRTTMRQANGLGLSANQIGLNLKVFVAEVQTNNATKFYAVFNPRLEKIGGEKILFEEGCLSIPLTYGVVERPDRAVLIGQDKHGKSIKIKAWGLLARVFQHEVDHLNGALFVDKAKSVHKPGKEEGPKP